MRREKVEKNKKNKKREKIGNAKLMNYRKKKQGERYFQRMKDLSICDGIVEKGKM